MLATEQSTPQLFYSKKRDGNPSGQMSMEDLSKFVDLLLKKANDGYMILTFNGLGFDFDILAEESGRHKDCKQLARSHVDVMFHIFCLKGFGVGLDASAKAIGLSKSTDIEGWMVPQMWKDGKYKQVLEYVGQDCKITLEIAIKSDKDRTFRWITKRGSISSFDLPNGWLSVREAMRLPLPDTSWMDDPWPRSKFTNWLG
jgi:hypothetical protein